MDIDQKYDRSPAGRARQAKYNAGRKGLARRRRWAAKNRTVLAEYQRAYRLKKKTQRAA